MSALSDNQNLFKEWVKNYSAAIKIKEVYNDDRDNAKGFYSFLVEFKNWLYESIHKVLTPYKYNIDYEKTIRVYCNFIKDKILPICKIKIQTYTKSKLNDAHIYLNKWLDLEDDFYALASYRNLKMLAFYLERGKGNKLWQKTMPLFENFYFYAQHLVFNYSQEVLELIRASYFPGAGKTYAGNILCAFWFGYDEEMSILRITYSDDLCKIFIKQIGDIIGSKQFRKVFPKFDVGEGCGSENMELYSRFSIDVGFTFRFSSVANFFASTRDGQTTGKRGKVLIIDDLTKGADEAYDEKLHKRMVNKYDTEWCSRADSSYQPVIALGTMWSNLDLLNVLYDRAYKSSSIIKDSETYKYTKIAYNKDGSVNSIFISTPMLDYDTDESTCPLRYKTEKMREKRDNMDEYLWNAVYQQRPTPPEEFLFDYKNLNTYTNENYPFKEMKENTTECKAFIDPTRTGKDFFAMGIFKRYKNGDNWSKWYLIDCIFQQEATRNLYYEIANKIILHNVNDLGYENNIDGSFDTLMKKILREMNYANPITIETFFSSGESKQTKIRNASFGMKSEIVYPSVKMFSLNSEMGKGMNQFTTWSISQKYGDHDDFPDMISMFVKYYCESKMQNTMRVLTRAEIGL